MQSLPLPQLLVQAQVRAIQTLIARKYRRFKERQCRVAQKRKIRISLPRESIQVLLSGSFTEPPWSFSQPLRYSLTSNDLFATVWLKPGDTFQLKKKDEVKLHPSFPVVTVSTSQVQGIGLANLFLYESSPLATVSLVRDSGFVFDSGLYLKGKTLDSYEDASFQTPKALGVADGVSAWRRYGIDSGRFARELMGYCKKIQLKSGTSRHTLATGLSEAHAKVQAYGSSTVLLGFLANSCLFLSTLGDSRAMIVRWIHEKPVIVFKSGISVHSFNTPYQLAHIPANLDPEAFVQDTSADALYYSLEIETGDLLIFGTDGLWDNIYDWELISLLGKEKQFSSSQRITEKIGEEAFKNSKAEKAGPFQDAAKQAYPELQWRGGKVDDITVLAAWAVALS